MTHNVYICSTTRACPDDKNRKSMRKTGYVFMACFLSMTALVHAQNDRPQVYGSAGFAIPGMSAIAFAPTTTLQGKPLTPSYKAAPTMQTARHRPADRMPGNDVGISQDTTFHTNRSHGAEESMSPGYPIPLSLYHNYDPLYQGLNVSMGLSVFSQFGKHARKGAGFTQSLSATYLHPLGKKAWIAAGGYVDHTIWGGDSYTTGGLYGELGYQFNDHWSAYIYGRKSLVSSGAEAYGYPYGHGMYGIRTPYMYDNLGDKLGAAVRWTPNPTLSIELSVEKNWYPNNRFGYDDKFKYNYPLPKK